MDTAKTVRFVLLHFSSHKLELWLLTKYLDTMESTYCSSLFNKNKNGLNFKMYYNFIK